MNIAGDLDAFANLAEAVGLTEGGELKGGWFENPIGTADGTSRGLSSIIYTNDQREALMAFVDEVLGAPDRETQNNAVWVPLFSDSGATIFAVVNTVEGAAQIGFGVEYESSSATPSVAVRSHVPVFQLPREGGAAPDTSGSLPDWSLLGREGGCIELSLDVNISNAAPVSGELFLGGVYLAACIPTSDSDSFTLSLGLRRLQLPGTSAPRDLDLSIESLEELDSEVLEFFTGLLEAQAEALNPADSNTAPFAAISALLGIRSLPNIPSFPFERLINIGVPAVVEWLEFIMTDDSARDAWLTQLANLLGGTVNTGRDSIEFSSGAVTGSVGVRIGSAAGGGVLITPWVEAALRPRVGAEVRLSADVLSADTTDGNVVALPNISCTAVFGRDAGSPSDLLDSASQRIGSIHTGFTLQQGSPAFTLTAHDVTLAGTNHTLLDLSSPDAALEAASSVVDGALQSLLDALGRPGELAAILIGLDPPDSIDSINASDIINDPLQAVTTYWDALTNNESAFSAAVAAIRELITGITTAIPGDGTFADPLIIDIAPLELLVWRDGPELCVDIRLRVGTELNDELETLVGVRAGLLCVNLVEPDVIAMSRAVGSVVMRRIDEATARLDLGPVDLAVDSVGLDVIWSARGGLNVELHAPGLAVGIETENGLPLSLDIPLPVFNADGTVTYEPDWSQVEQLLAELLTQSGSEVIDAIINIIGWNNGTARLRLANLIDDPQAALRSWLAELVLDCDNIRTALGPLASLLSGFRLSTPFGNGDERKPFRAAVAGEHRAPGVAMWFEPGCPLPQQRYQTRRGLIDTGLVQEEAELVDALKQASEVLPNLEDLLTGRDNLAQGLQELTNRMVGTDGLVGRPSSLPDGVNGIDIEGYSYRELVALGAIDAFDSEVFEETPNAILYIGCEDLWANTFSNNSIDARAATPSRTVSASADGTWSLALPLPAEAAADRPDRGAVGEQAARIIAALDGRTEPISIVAYGSAAAAAINAANTVTSIDRVVTVGCPWGGFSTNAFTSGLGADALRFIEQVRRPNNQVSDDEPDNQITEALLAGESGPQLQIGYMIDRAAMVANLVEVTLGDIPSAADQVIRSGLQVDAAFGLLDKDTLSVGLAYLIDDAINYQYSLYEDPVQPPESLHAGIDMPVVDLDLGGVLIGVGAILELISFDRGVDGNGFEINAEQQLILNCHFGVHDGWLVGGPGAIQNDINVRWVSARIKLPLGDNSVGDNSVGDSSQTAEAQLTLHEASYFGVQRQRWLVDINANEIVDSLPNSEVHIMLDAVVAKLSLASAEFSQLLEQIGLVRNGGYDPQGLDRLIFDTKLIIDNALNSDAAELARIIRALSGFDGSGSVVRWNIDQVNVELDLQDRSVRTSFSHSLPNLPLISANIYLDSLGLIATAALGDIDPVSGGVEFRARFSSSLPSASSGLNIAWQLPGATDTTTIELLPLTQPAELVKIFASLVPASLSVSLLEYVRSNAEQAEREAIEGVLESLSLLAPSLGSDVSRIRLPWLLFIKPDAWLRHAASAWVSDPFAEAISLFESLVPIVAPSRVGSGWPLNDDVSLLYAVKDGRLDLSVDVGVEHALDSVTMALNLLGGISIGRDGTVLPLLSSSLRFDDKGLEFNIQPTVQLNLLRAEPLAPIAIYPSGAGFGNLLSVGVGMAIPVALNALIGERDNANASLQRDVARVVFDVGSALDLLESNQFTEPKITTFAADPIRGLTANLNQLAGIGITNLASALDPAGSLVTTSNDGAGRTRLIFGVAQTVSLVLDGSSQGPAIELSGDIDIDNVGIISIEQVRIGLNGVQVSAGFVAANIEIGNGLTLMPLISAKVGVTSSGFDRLIGIGLATDGIGDQSVEFRWALNGTPPRMVVVNRNESGESEASNPENVAMALLSLTVPMVVNVALEALDPLGNQVIRVLQNVAFTGGSSNLDPNLITDFKDPAKLLDRVYELAFNLASEDIKITIDGKVDIGFTGDGNRAGVFVSLKENERIALGSGNPSVALEVVSSWITAPGIGPGLSIFLIEKDGDTFELQPSFAIAGLGVRVSKTSGALLDLGVMAIDAIGVHTYAEVASAGIGAGINVQLDGLTFTPSAGAGDNAVANNIMSDAADSASPSTRPSFSPSLAVQKAPGNDVGVTLRAGDPPGPWWVGVQRQLGPLYLEQFGFDVTEQNGSINGMSLLFDARISLFGLNAEVDQLGLHWQGGDIFNTNNWAVDLQGLAVSGDFTGLSISGGLLKTNLDGSIGYVGMLMGRFGVYGLSLFGGYTDDDGLPSFFVFGAIQGPIGGPPAFFLTGIGGGLGIKRGLRVPDDLSKFGDYPFIKALDPAASVSQNPLQELRELAAYFPPEPGNMWFAAGISFTSFALVDGVAVVSVSFGNGLELNLFGLARLALPRPQAALVSIELGLLARFSSREGLFLIQAQLTDNSWLLYPEVRLTGGFAFATWWKGANAGQFVLTLGGYHPSFSREGYPVVPRLGLEWRVTDDIVIKGGAYFALTSEALMAGVAIEVSADFGFVWAKITFGADGIVYFDPFYFTVDAYARIAAGIRIKTFFGTIRISISIGATVHVEGPSFHGRATIEVGPADITVPFGDQTPRRGVPLDWIAFVPKYLEQAAPGTATVVSGVSGKGSLPAATGGDTSAPSSDGSAERPFEVYAEFEMSLVTTVPTKFFDFGDPKNDTPINPILSDGRSYDLGLGPMGAIELESVLEVRLQQKLGPRQLWFNKNTELQRLVAGIRDNNDIDGPSYGIEAFPLGVWGAPKDPNLPSDPLPKGDVVFAGNRLKLVAKAHIPEGTGDPIDYYRVDSGRRPLPLTATGNSRASLLNIAGGLSVDEFANSASSALRLAEARLFAHRPAVVANGLIQGSQRSATARASYARSRTAPPLFGTLTEGLVSQNDRRAAAENMPSRNVPAIPAQRSPFITGYMVGGAGVTAGVTGTSVRNRRIKRRPAPSLDSVHGRLGRSLPIKMTRSAAPPVISNKTVLVRGSVPFTNLAGVARSYRGGHIGSPVGNALVSGLNSPIQRSTNARRNQPRGLEQGSKIRAGDVVAMRLPDSATDLGDARPTLKIEGNARVVMLKGNGIVTLDKTVSNGNIEVPKCIASIAVQADGGALGTLDTGTKVIGWHDQSQLARLGGRSALGANCVVNAEGAQGRAKVGWNIACDFVREASAVSTHLSSAVRTIGVVLRGTHAQHARDMEIGLTGARRVSESDPSNKPIIIQSGPRVTMLFEVIPNVGAPEVVVRVTAGGTRQISGVIGSGEGADQMADLIAERGLVAVVTRLREVSGDGCVLTWNDADRTPRASTPRRLKKTAKKVTKKTRKKVVKKTSRKANKRAAKRSTKNNRGAK